MASNKSHEKELLLYLLDAVDNIRLVDPEDIPNIDLYMDQVTTFMDEHLTHSRRHEQDKILTKTMINNYAKNDLLPAPERKKYTREHIMILVFIYYFKGILPLNDIQSILKPLGERYFHSSTGRDIADLYEEVMRMDHDRQKTFREEVNDMEDAAADYFQDAKGEEREFLRVFSMINMLAFDVFARKMLIEKLIDRYFAEDPADKGKSKKKKKAAPSGQEEDS